MAIVTITVTGAKEAAAYIGKLDRRTEDWSPAFKRVRKRYSEMVRDVFHMEGGQWGVAKWPQLSTMRQRIRAGYRSPRTARSSVGAAHPILRWTGALERAATAQRPYSETDHGRTIFTPRSGYTPEAPTTISYLLQEGKTDMYIGLVGPKAIHQEGGVVGKYTIPARPFWPWSITTDSALTHVWGMYLDDIIAK